MNPRRPSRIALALFDCLVADDDPLKGDLIEEFENRQSQWWLWRQVIGTVVSRGPFRALPSHTSAGMLAVGIALLMLVSFEAVLITNLTIRLVFGPPFPNISGYLYLFHRPQASGSPAPVISETSLVWAVAGVLFVLASVPIGRGIARLHERHYILALAAFGVSIMLCAAITIETSFLVQFVLTLAFMVGLLVPRAIDTSNAGGYPPRRDKRPLT